MGSPDALPAQLAPPVLASSSPAVRFTWPGALRLATTVAGTVITALAPHYGGQSWYPVLVAAFAGLGIHAVHSLSTGSGQLGGSNG